MSSIFSICVLENLFNLDCSDMFSLLSSYGLINRSGQLDHMSESSLAHFLVLGV